MFLFLYFFLPDNQIGIVPILQLCCWQFCLQTNKPGHVIRYRTSLPLSLVCFFPFFIRSKGIGYYSIRENHIFFLLPLLPGMRFNQAAGVKTCLVFPAAIDQQTELRRANLNKPRRAFLSLAAHHTLWWMGDPFFQDFPVSYSKRAMCKNGRERENSYNSQRDVVWIFLNSISPLQWSQIGANRIGYATDVRFSLSEPTDRERKIAAVKTISIFFLSGRVNIQVKSSSSS